LYWEVGKEDNDRYIINDKFEGNSLAWAINFDELKNQKLGSKTTTRDNKLEYFYTVDIGSDSMVCLNLDTGEKVYKQG
jgi:hypothetical protein